MIHHSRRTLLIAPLLLATLILPGCGMYQSARRKLGFGGNQVAYNGGYTNTQTYPAPSAQPSESAIQPGHSTDPDSFNEDYLPYDGGQPTQSSDYFQPPAQPTIAPTDRLDPPPAPPAQPQLPPAKPNQPIIEKDVRLQRERDTENQLIKTRRAPHLFAPDGVRSIYDRFRKSEQPTPATAKPKGPIAQNIFPDRTAQTCRYVDTPSPAPVQLGAPETDLNPQPYANRAGLARTDEMRTTTWSSQQASPSDYKHPLLADPTGMPYGRSF